MVRINDIDELLGTSVHLTKDTDRKNKVLIEKINKTERYI